MDDLLFPEDIAKRYHVSLKTARKYMREMRHRTRPLAVTPEAVKEWDDSKTVTPPKRSSKNNATPPPKPKKQPDDGKFIIPRIRPA